MTDTIQYNTDPRELYQYIELLGEGSYGSVYKVLERPSGKPYALKIVRVESDGQEMDELKKEISILSQCHSPYIVQYFSSYCYNGEIAIAMEYCDAGSIADLMQATKSTLSSEEIAAVCANVVLGLAYLHERRNIHRDVKAGNILLSQSGNAKLADFGVSAQLNNTVAKRQTVIGTPFWMAPEVIQETTYDGKADIWSLGITVIEMAEGDPPHSNLHPMRAIFLIPNRAPPTFKYPENYGSELKDFVSQCLKKNPIDRPSAAKLLEHPFIKDQVIALRRGEGSPAIRKLLDKSMDAIGVFRGNNSNEEESDEEHFVDQPDQDHEMEEDSSANTLVAAFRRASDDTASTQSGTVVYKAKPDTVYDSEDEFYYGGSTSASGERTKHNATMIHKASENNTNHSKSDDMPSFMKYFHQQKTGPVSPTTSFNIELPVSPTTSICRIQDALQNLTKEFVEQKVALERNYIQKRLDLQLQIEELRKLQQHQSA